ncbi:hypothetical protein B0J17DRAFT_278640 [Rhizoctonia solani]|nr:hypothetical protein B0J17DRAFT_278640 [Rhizoctonia solani]
MPRPEPGEPSSGSEDEYEVEYIYAAKWTETGWDYEVHWYGYDTEYDTWEPEANLTDYGSADLVDRFWKEFPKKRHSRPIVGTKYTAPAEWLVIERERFLARRQRDQPVKGRETPPRKAAKTPILLEGDPESGSGDSDDEDVLRSSSDRDDEDVLHSSSASEDVPLITTTRRRSNAGSSTGTGTKVRAQAQAERRRKPVQSTKSNSRPQLKATAASKTSHAVPPKAPPAAPRAMHAPTKAIITAQSSTTPGIRKITTISREPVVARRGRAPMNRPSMQAGDISGSFVGIGTKGKQAERAGEVIALGRQSTTPNTSATALYAGMSMRKNTRPSENAAHDTTAETNDNGPTVASPIEVSPTEPGLPPVLAAVNDFIADIAAGISHPNSPIPSPTNSLFDGPYDEDEEIAQPLDDFSHMDVDIYVPGFDDPPPPPPVTIQPRPKPPTAKPTRPTISTEPNVTRGSIDGPVSARGPSLQIVRSVSLQWLRLFLFHRLNRLSPAHGYGPGNYILRPRRPTLIMGMLPKTSPAVPASCNR